MFAVNILMLLFLLAVACLLHAWVKELHAHPAAWRRRTREADSAAVRSGPHQDEGGPGWLNPRVRLYCDGGLNVHLLAGQSPEDDQSSLHPKIPRIQLNNTSSVNERVRQGARLWELELARMCVWDDAKDEKCLTPGESDVPERMSWETCQLADEAVVVSCCVFLFWVTSDCPLYLSHVT